ncbi:MAG TPA: LLM class F420-dependent oxidoreductase [Acidimicrobiaceae bacterium]|nr:LLM class F420-dependent oxidoreductase [Acidimicrobiaceae bacterium]
MPKVGVSLGALSPRVWPQLVRAADALGFESVWIPEHLVLPVAMAGSPRPGETHPPIPPTTPVFDAWAYLAYLAGLTEHIRLGTFVYNLGLRHPFVAARAVQTVDAVSGGRVEVGVGAGWLAAEWEAAGLDFSSRGARLDEALTICRRLWSEPVVEHRGRFYAFAPVAFEPKPVQQPHPPIHIGGVSEAALRRAVTVGDGWIGMLSTPNEVAGYVGRLKKLSDEAGRTQPVQVTAGGSAASVADLERWAEAGLDRLLLSDLGSTSVALSTLNARAEQLAEALG